MKEYSSFSFSRISRALRRDVPIAFAFAFLASFACIDQAFAAGGVINLGQLLCSLKSHGMGPIPDLFSAIAYIAGCFMIGNGLFELVRHHDNPRERPIHHPILRLSAGGALMAAPNVASILIGTFYQTPASGGIASCSPGAVKAASGGVGLDVLITNLINNINSPMTSALSALAVIIGLFMIIRGLMKASKYNTDPRAHSMVHIVANLSIGALLVVVGQSLDMMLSTVFGGLNQAGLEGSSVVNGWQFVNQLGLQNSQFTTAIGAALNFFQLIGLIAFIRGWMILKNAAEGSGQSTLAQGITHVLGGTVALNIFNFLEIMDKTFGTGFL